MALVSYDCSSGSENEEDVQVEKKSKLIEPATNLLLKDGNAAIQDKSETGFNHASKSVLGSDEVEKEFQMRIPASVRQIKTIDKRSGKVQILAPTLGGIDSDSDEEQSRDEARRRAVSKPKNPAEKRSSALLNMLPPARNREVLRRNRNETETPTTEMNFLKVKPSAKVDAEVTEEQQSQPEATKTIARKSVAAGFVPSQISRRLNVDKDLDETSSKVSKKETDEMSKFFTFADDEIPISVSASASAASVASSKSFLPSIAASTTNSTVREPEEADEDYEAMVQQQQQNTSGDLGLDEAALRRLVGKSQLGRASATVSVGAGPSWLAPAAEIDANAYRTPVHELARELTHADERRALASRLHVQATNSTEKRKHQITWLAAQAKERELELLNSWAESKFNRRQTQAKYGF